MWATQQSLWNLIYQISSDSSYDSTTKVTDIHYKYCPPYMIRLTITLPLQPQTMPFFMWKILQLELAAYTIIYICAPHTCKFTTQPQPPIRAPVTDRTHLRTCTFIPTRLPAHHAYSPPLNQSVKTVASGEWMKVANELWALIFSPRQQVVCTRCVSL